jgi:8-oxo-dGTP pyrophosphatase MutT (NUDIX family)
MQYGKQHHVDVKARAAGAVIFNVKNEILLVQELHRSKKGLWHIPSGTIETGESPVEAAKREITEEAGLRIELSTYLNTYVGCFDDGELVLRHVWIESFPVDQQLAPQLKDEIGAVRFFSQQEVQEMYQRNGLRMYHTKLMVDDALAFLSGA